MDSYLSEQRPVAGSCKHGREKSWSVKSREFFFIVWPTRSFSGMDTPHGVGVVEVWWCAQQIRNNLETGHGD
jgi:hypothetical protein